MRLVDNVNLHLTYLTEALMISLVASFELGPAHPLRNVGGMIKLA